MIQRSLLLGCFSLVIWQGFVWYFQIPAFMLPSPLLVAITGWHNAHLIMQQALPTLLEICLGLFFGTILGVMSALLMAYCRLIHHWLKPLLLISQAIPTFAIAPLLVLWFGYGMSSKIITTIIMIFFPITSAFLDGLQRTPAAWEALATTMNASPWRLLWYIKIPAALPALASGLRVAAAIAPIGAVAGEWVGASQGLGFLMLNANGRLNVALMFAALFTLVVIGLTLFFTLDKLLSYWLPWEREYK